MESEDRALKKQFHADLKKVFSPDSLDTLFDYYWEQSQSMGEPMEYDINVVQGDWSEFLDEIEAAEVFGYDDYWDLEENETVLITEKGTILVYTGSNV